MNLLLRRPLHSTLLALMVLVRAGAASADVTQLGFDRYLTLAKDLSQKVDIFRDARQADPRAEFFGGSVRDYLYWLKGHFRDAHTPADALEVERKLRARENIQVREFVVGESDIDIAQTSNLALDRFKYGIRHIDSISPERFNPLTKVGQDELNQGHIPTEKIRLGKNGLVVGAFGDGAKEIYIGKPTLHLADSQAFESTYYAQKKLNHPFLLAVRFVRALALNYYYQHGAAYPTPEVLFDIDPASKAALQSAIAQASVPGALVPHFKMDRFTTWAHRIVEKTFRSYTNPTAAHLLFKQFGLDRIVAMYSHKLPAINQYLFATPPVSPDTVRSDLAQLGTTPEALFVDPRIEMPGLRLFHGTRTDEAFRSILMEGTLPSTVGLAGPGLYGVRREEVSFAITWGGSIDRVVELQISPEARILDATQGEGARLLAAVNGDFDELARRTHADIIQYPYTPSRAYVVKNSAVLNRPNGYTRPLMSLGRAIELATEARDETGIVQIFDSIRLNRFSSAEAAEIPGKAPYLQSPEAQSLYGELDSAKAPKLSDGAKLSAMHSIATLRKLARMAEASDASVPERQKSGLLENAAGAISQLATDLLAIPSLTDADRVATMKYVAHQVLKLDQENGNHAVFSAVSAAEKRRRTETKIGWINQRISVLAGNRSTWANVTRAAKNIALGAVFYQAAKIAIQGSLRDMGGRLEYIPHFIAGAMGFVTLGTVAIVTHQSIRDYQARFGERDRREKEARILLAEFKNYRDPTGAPLPGSPRCLTEKFSGIFGR